MSTHPRPEGNERSTESDAPDDSAGPSSSARALHMLKIAAHYALLGFAPVMSVIALIVAIFALTGGHSSEGRYGEMSAKLETVSAAQAALKADQESLRFNMGRHKGQQEEELGNRDEILALMVHDVSVLQTKMKISPTLQEQLHQPASSAVTAPPVISAPASATAKASAMPEHGAAESKHAESKPAEGKHAESKPAESKPAEKKLTPQVQAIKDAIEKFNRK